jgi:hypothetical protein
LTWKTRNGGAGSNPARRGASCTTLASTLTRPPCRTLRALALRGTPRGRTGASSGRRGESGALESAGWPPTGPGKTHTMYDRVLCQSLTGAFFVHVVRVALGLEPVHLGRTQFFSPRNHLASVYCRVFGGKKTVTSYPRLLSSRPRFATTSSKPPYGCGGPRKNWVDTSATERILVPVARPARCRYVPWNRPARFRYVPVARPARCRHVPPAH